jgi:putative N6-adenine-specific DNA methylase
MDGSQLLACAAATAPGLEPLAVAELDLLGLRGTTVEAGVVEFTADAAGFAAALISLRTVSRITIRLASFRARTFPELERYAANLPWQRYLERGIGVHFRVTSRKSRLYHAGAIAERLERSALAQVPGLRLIRAASDAAALEDDVTRLPSVVRLVVRILRDEVAISIDAAGGGMHRRGWRTDGGKAPLRETLAAAMLAAVTPDLHVGWNQPVADPLCGSGTIPIEAALWARRIAPGSRRRFAAELWPHLRQVVEDARKIAVATELASTPIAILAQDRDAGAIEAATANAERAGVSADLMIKRAPVSALRADEGGGWIVTNPPYGLRIGDREQLRDLYASLGRLVTARRPYWGLAVLSADPRLDGQLSGQRSVVWQSTNGGVAVRLVVSQPR